MNSRLLAGVLVVSASAVLAQAAPQSNAPAAQQKAKAASTAQAPQQSHDEGTRIFQQNCSRCHNVPEGFSSRISGTIVRHMRVRAGLSEHDAEELRRFFNP